MKKFGKADLPDIGFISFFLLFGMFGVWRSVAKNDHAFVYLSSVSFAAAFLCMNAWISIRKSRRAQEEMERKTKELKKKIQAIAKEPFE